MVQGSISGLPCPQPRLPADIGLGGGAMRSWNLRFSAGLLAKLQLHPPLEGCLQPGATLAGLLDFRPAREASARSTAAPLVSAGWLEACYPSVWTGHTHTLYSRFEEVMCLC